MRSLSMGRVFTWGKHKSLSSKSQARLAGSPHSKWFSSEPVWLEESKRILFILRSLFPFSNLFSRVWRRNVIIFSWEKKKIVSSEREELKVKVCASFIHAEMAKLAVALPTECCFCLYLLFIWWGNWLMHCTVLFHIFSSPDAGVPFSASATLNN